MHTQHRTIHRIKIPSSIVVTSQFLTIKMVKIFDSLVFSHTVEWHRLILSENAERKKGTMQMNL